MGVTGQIAQHLLGPCEWRLAINHPVDAPQRGDEAFERSLVGESGMGVEEVQLAGIVPRNRRASTLTWTRKLEREATHRALSSESPPPGTIICTCGWWVSAEPQVCSTAVIPIRAPRRLGSAAMASVVSAAAFISRL